MTEMVEMVIDSVRVSLMSPQRVVVLRRHDAQIYLPIWVGAYEAEAITIALQEVEVARPLTQDLIKNVITTLEGKVLRVEVVALKEDVYFANIVLEQNGKILDIDARPSDAIALAVRTHAPILAHREVLDEAAITPEKDMQEAGSSEKSQIQPDELTPTQEVDQDRLDVYEDFLKKLGGESDEDTPKE